MSESEPSKARVILQQAKSYESMTWLGLLFLPLTYIFFVMSRNKVQEASLFKLSDEERKLAKSISDSARNITITITVLYLFVIIGWFGRLVAVGVM